VLPHLPGLITSKIMETKLMKIEAGAKLPAGIIEGTEAFWFNGEKWVIHEGTAMLFNRAPAKIQNMIAEQFLKDTRSREYLEKKMKITGFREGFDWWYHCVVGALDETPDFKDGRLNADAYNRGCKNFDCVHRGKFCSVATGLKNYEVETITVLKQGKTFEETADMLCISLSGLKSRIEKIKEKLGAANMASLIAIAASIGI